MAKPIRIELEFSGWQPAHISSEGDVMRPSTAQEMAQVIASDIALRLENCIGAGKLKIKVKPLN